MTIYLAAPFLGEEGKREKAIIAADILREKGFEVFEPYKYRIPHAWDYPNNEWGAMVFMNDIHAIDTSDIIVVLSYGRNSPAGTNWEAGYAFGSGKKIILVEMEPGEIMSLMVANGRYATVKGLSGLRDYDFTAMLKTRTDTEQT